MKTIYYNGAVYTGFLPLAEAFVVADGRFCFAGTSQEAKSLAEDGDFCVDLKGRFVCSGFNDSHMHLLNYGNVLQGAQLAGRTKSLADMLQCLREFLENHLCREDAWLIGRGWNQDFFTDEHRMPDRFDLDKVSDKVPVCAIRACGHCLVVNSRALKILGVTEESRQPEGGKIGTEHGRLDGRFYDNAMDLVFEALPAPGREEIKDMLLSAARELNAL